MPRLFVNSYDTVFDETYKNDIEIVDENEQSVHKGIIERLDADFNETAFSFVHVYKSPNNEFAFIAKGAPEGHHEIVITGVAWVDQK